MENSTSHFRLNITQIINQFKRIHRRNLSPVIRSELSLEKLGISRKQTKCSSDKELYAICFTMINHIEQFQKTVVKPHTGLIEFTDSLKQTLGEYIVIDEALLHTKKYCKKLTLSIIQHVNILKISIKNQSLHEIKRLGREIIQFGDQEESSKLINIMNDHASRHRYFSQLANYFQQLELAYHQDPFVVIKH